MTKIATDAFLRKANLRPKGTRFISHPSQDGVIACHPHHPAVWLKFDGTTYELAPQDREKYRTIESRQFEGV